MRKSSGVSANVRVALASAALLVSAATNAAWENVPEVSMLVGAADNARLDASGSQDSASMSTIDAATTLSNFTERGNIYVAPRIQIDTYLDSQNEELDSEDYFFDAGGSYRWRLVNANFRSAYRRRSILNAEIADVEPVDPDADPGDIIDSETGRLSFFQEQREDWNVTGNVDFRLTERNRFQVGALRRTVAYSGGAASSGRWRPTSSKGAFSSSPSSSSSSATCGPG